MKKLIIILVLLFSLNLVLAGGLEDIELTKDNQVYKIDVKDGLAIPQYERSTIIVDNVGSTTVDLKIFGNDGTVILYYTLDKKNIIKVDFNKDKIYDAEIGFIKKDNNKAIIVIKGSNEVNPFNDWSPTTSRTTTTIAQEDITGDVVADITGQTTRTPTVTRGIFITLISAIGLLIFYYIFKKK